MKFSILFLVLLSISISSYSQEQVAEESSSKQNFIQKWWHSSTHKLTQIYDEGQNNLFLTGYAYHDRSTYTKEKMKDLNEGAYGYGLGRTIINDKGNTQLIYGMGHLDSHKDLQLDLGYAWLKNFSITDNSRVGVGFTALFVSRSDIGGHFPIPIALPMAGIDIGNVSINAVLIPKLNDGINNGNVVFFFGKYSWDRKKI